MSSNIDIRRLKSEAHNLKPVVRIGNKGLTQAVHKEVDVALDAHELIKVKVIADKDDRQVIIEELCSQHKAVLVQSIGQVCVLYRENDSEE